MTPVRPRRQAANVQRGGLIFRWRYMAAILGGSATIPMICRQQFLLPASAGHDWNGANYDGLRKGNCFGGTW